MIAPGALVTPEPRRIALATHGNPCAEEVTTTHVPLLWPNKGHIELVLGYDETSACIVGFIEPGAVALVLAVAFDVRAPGNAAARDWALFITSGHATVGWGVIDDRGAILREVARAQ